MYRGNIIECFHWGGKQPEFKAIVNGLTKSEGISGPPSLRVAGEIPSGPGEKDKGIFEIWLATEDNEKCIEPISLEVKGLHRCKTVDMGEKTDEKMSLKALLMSGSEFNWLFPK